jgi:hypothetical protein
MTNAQSALFSKLVDLNWEIDQLFMQGKASEAFKLSDQYIETERALIEDMGREAYDRFIEMGRQMFAPAV